MVVDIESRVEIKELKANLGGSYDKKTLGRHSSTNIKFVHYARVYTRDVSTDFMWGNDNSFWGYGEWDNTYSNDLVLRRVVQNNGVYEEFFITNDFEGGGDAVWNTTTNKLEG